MCIICLEFNKHRDFRDAERMIEAARREADSISAEHLRELEDELERLEDLKVKDPQVKISES